VQYTPGYNVSLMMGVRHVDMDFHEQGVRAIGFDSRYGTTFTVAEVGARFTGELVPGSRHKLFGIVVVGAGPGHYHELTTGFRPFSENAVTFTTEAALGYHFEVRDLVPRHYLNNLSIEARFRGFLYDFLGGGRLVRPNGQPGYFGERTGGAWGPEFNITQTF
jgi:hypothetical protein